MNTLFLESHECLNNRERKILITLFTRGNYAKTKNLANELQRRNVKIEIAVGGTLLTDLSSLNDEIKNDMGIDYKMGEKFCEQTALIDVCRETLEKTFSILKNGNHDYVIVVGDRFELLSVVQACLITNTKIIHIEGGERSGSIDEGIRHAISKLAHIHLTANNETAGYLEKIGKT